MHSSSVFLLENGSPLSWGLSGMGIKPGLQARAEVECRVRPTDAPTITPRKTGPLLRYLSDNQAIKSA